MHNIKIEKKKIKMKKKQKVEYIKLIIIIKKKVLQSVCIICVLYG